MSYHSFGTCQSERQHEITNTTLCPYWQTMKVVTIGIVSNSYNKLDCKINQNPNQITKHQIM